MKMSYMDTIALLITGGAGAITLVMWLIYRHRHSEERKRRDHPTPAAE
jgi:hypothetical protein